MAEPIVETGVVRVPPGVKMGNCKGIGTTGFVALLSPTVLKFPHGDGQETINCDKERDVYETFQGKSAPSSILEYRGATTLHGILLEYAELGNVRQYLQTHSPCLAVRLRWAQQAAEALVFTHSLGIFHNDINNSNFFLTKQLDLKVGDFGSASLDGRGSSLHSTTHQLPDVDIGTRHTDIFAFGSSLFELMTGNVPYQEMRHDHCGVEDLFRRKIFPDLGNVKALKEVILGCWTQKFDSMEGVLEDIRKDRHANDSSTDSAPISTLALLFSTILLGHVAHNVFRSR
ncbi:MAG: hypothetical protein M1837_007233 [Sclerophora amabilis]|nr:MAG: hypothetical protein M1837_007233 [Sclerophora amabilis]